ncbi:MAG: hypothetical protein JOZ69_18535, partial [Myxococcales bacterium]|nr:hypothetical protein [Myxococcales bacterium]
MPPSPSSPARGTARSKLALLLVPAAIAASGALLALRLHFQPPTIPPYAITGADAASTEVRALRPGDRFEMELRPATPSAGAIGARGFLLRGDEVRPWDPPFDVDQGGTVRIHGDASALFA